MTGEDELSHLLFATPPLYRLMLKVFVILRHE
jgi:hypothetical protein